ncbi:MAG: DUF4357 domain-containing protein, partial [Mariprofundus sp.]
DEKMRIYIGEAENLFDRLKQHLAGKDFWHEAIVFFSKDEPPKKHSEKLYIKGARGANASGLSVTDGFVVFSGSKAAKEISPAFKKHNYLKLRSSLIERGILSDQGDYLCFSGDYVFSTPSAAAAIVMGRSANGLTEWKTHSGQILKALEQNE